MELDKKIEWLKKEIDFCKEQEEIYAFRKEVAGKELKNLNQNYPALRQEEMINFVSDIYGGSPDRFAIMKDTVHSGKAIEVLQNAEEKPIKDMSVLR